MAKKTRIATPTKAPRKQSKEVQFTELHNTITAIANVLENVECEILQGGRFYGALDERSRKELFQEIGNAIGIIRDASYNCFTFVQPIEDALATLNTTLGG